MNQDWTAGRKYSEFCFYWNRREVSLYLSFHAIPSNCFLWHKNTSRAKHFSKIMWHLNSLNWEENSGRYFDPGKRKIYKAMVHYAMITSGMGLLWKWTLVTDLITKQPATTSNIYFSKPRWTFRAQFFFFLSSHFLELPDELSASCNYGRPLSHTSRTRHTLLTQRTEGWFHFHRRNRRGTNTACHN